MSGTSLYRLTQDFGEFQAAMESSEDGELPALAIAELEKMQIAFELKADGVCWYAMDYDTRAAAKEMAIEKIKKSAESDRNNAKRLRDYLKLCMESKGDKKVKTEHFTLSICKNSQPSVTLKGEAVPPGFQRFPPAELDKKKAVEAWKQQQTAFEAWKKNIVWESHTPEDIQCLMETWWRDNAKLPPEITVTVLNHLRIS